MTIDLSQTGGFIYFLGARNAFVSTKPIRMCLYSRYSNKAILNGANIYTTNAYFNLVPILNYTNWHSYAWQYDNLDLQTEDIEGYYWCEIDVNIAGEVWTNINRELVKVVNTFNREAGGNSIEYQGNNENNEQIIYFR
jgi:hypothetical protein